MEGTVEYTEVVPNERIVAKIHWFGESPTWVFSFEPAKGGTKLTAEGEWQVKASVVGTRVEGMVVKGHQKPIEDLLATREVPGGGRSDCSCVTKRPCSP